MKYCDVVEGKDEMKGREGRSTGVEVKDDGFLCRSAKERSNFADI